nr:head-tail adaptor protein [Haloechinothrix aidingensis]
MLNRTVAVWRRDISTDDVGGQTYSWSKVGDVAARLPQPSASEQLVAHQDGAEHTQAIYVLPTVDVRRGDQLRDGDLTYRVVAVVTPSIAAYQRCDTERTQEEPT